MNLSFRISILLVAAMMMFPYDGHALTPEKQKKGLKKKANVSLNVTNKKTFPKKTYFNFGLVSNFSRLHGVGVNAFSSINHYYTKGFQMAGFTNITGLKTEGMQVAGIANVTGKRSSGLQISGIMNVAGQSAKGMQLSGLGNVTGKNQHGFFLSGMVNLCSKRSEGVQIAGVSNLTGNDHKGVALSGLMNVAGGNSKGIQVSGLLNVVADTAKSVQLSALGNVSVNNSGLQLATANYNENNNGLQLGVVNLNVGTCKGLQMGIFNVSADSSARQIGCINITPQTRTQLVLSGGNTNKFNLGIRFRNRYTFTQLGLGGYHLGLNKDFSLSVIYKAGAYYAITPRLNLYGGLEYDHIECLKNKHDGYGKRRYALQPFINLEYQFTKRLGAFVSGGYEWNRAYKGGGMTDHKTAFEIGVVLW